jgi:hypothetical protein
MRKGEKRRERRLIPLGINNNNIEKKQDGRV